MADHEMTDADPPRRTLPSSFIPINQAASGPSFDSDNTSRVLVRRQRNQGTHDRPIDLSDDSGMAAPAPDVHQSTSTASAMSSLTLNGGNAAAGRGIIQVPNSMARLWFARDVKNKKKGLRYKREDDSLKETSRKTKL
jgi:hypothetical protein